MTTRRFSCFGLIRQTCGTAAMLLARTVLGAMMAAWLAAPVVAIDLVWDDEGGSADKTWTNLGNWNPDNLPDQADDVFIGVNVGGVNQAAALNDVTVLT